MRRNLNAKLSGDHQLWTEWILSENSILSHWAFLNRCGAVWPSHSKVTVIMLENKANSRSSCVQTLFSRKRFRMVPELILLSLGMVPAVTFVGWNPKFRRCVSVMEQSCCMVVFLGLQVRGRSETVPVAWYRRRTLSHYVLTVRSVLLLQKQTFRFPKIPIAPNLFCSCCCCCDKRGILTGAFLSVKSKYQTGCQ